MTDPTPDSRPPQAPKPFFRQQVFWLVVLAVLVVAGVIAAVAANGSAG